MGTLAAHSVRFLRGSWRRREKVGSMESVREGWASVLCNPRVSCTQGALFREWGGGWLLLLVANAPIPLPAFARDPVRLCSHRPV